MSEHASANAVDIAAFETRSGQKIDLLDDWKGNNSKAAFLRAARDGGCKIFNATLGPDYNSLHADHFHFDMGRWQTCR